jgi:hypothetical protein
MNYLAFLFVGALLCNCIQHLAAGLRGESFPTPFAKPRGIGLSPPLLNFGWGLGNAMSATLLLVRHGVPATAGPELAAVIAGFVAMGIYLSTHFGKVRQSSERN